MKGNLGEINLGGLLRFLTRYEFSGRLQLKAAGAEGLVFLSAGRIEGLEFSGGGRNLKGREAARSLVQLREGSFEYTDGEKAGSPGPSLNLSPESMILDAFRDPATAPAPNLPPDTAVLTLAPLPAGRNFGLEFLAKEWNILVLFDGNRNLGSVREASGLPGSEAAAVVGGLLTAGLLRRSRFSLPNLHAIAERWMGGMGWTLVDVECRKIPVARASMTMRHVLQLLDRIEASARSLIGRNRSQDMIAEMWEEVKR